MVTTDNRSEVSAAFDMLLDAIGLEIDAANRKVTTLTTARDYDQAGQMVEHAKQLDELRDRIVGLRDEWQRLGTTMGRLNGKAGTSKQRQRRRRMPVPRGAITSTHAFNDPILRALADLGGRARRADVLQHIEQTMRGELKPADFDSVPSDPRTIRWHQAASWARYRMVHQGLLRDDCPNGIWEITDKGRQYLAEQQGA